jgi:lactate dehydrogenase-like 2-hydroxyacid dehydrogenase
VAKQIGTVIAEQNRCKLMPRAVGLGQIGDRLAQLAKAFDMRVIGIRRDPRAGAYQISSTVAVDGEPS